GPCAALALLLLGAVLATGLLPGLDSLCVERAADDLVAHTGEVLHTTTTHQHHRVLLQVVTFARDVGGDLDLAGQLDARDLPKRRVRLLRGGSVHASAHTATLRAALEGRGLDLGDLVAATLTDQLVDGWHVPASCVLLLVTSWFSKSVYCGF